MSTFSRTCAVLLAASVGGCGAEPKFTPPPLAFVVAHAETFAAADTPAVTAVEPGTIVDALSDLDGCWGDAQLTPTAEVPVRAYFALVFDSAAGTLTEWARQEPFAVFTIVSGEAGSFTIADGNRITGDQAQIVDLQSGAVDESTRREIIWLATRTGDVLKLRLDGGSDLQDQRDENVVTYRRFTCP